MTCPFCNTEQNPHECTKVACHVKVIEGPKMPALKLPLKTICAIPPAKDKFKREIVIDKFSGVTFEASRTIHPHLLDMAVGPVYGHKEKVQLTRKQVDQMIAALHEAREFMG